MDLGERITPSGQYSQASERRENAAEGLFQHPVRVPIIIGTVRLYRLTCFHLYYFQNSTNGNPHPMWPIIEFIPDFIDGLFEQMRIQEYAEF